MSRNKLLLFIIAILLLANLVLVYFFFRGKETERPVASREKHGITQQLKDEVGFNEQQLLQYEERRTAHMAEMKKLFEEMRQTKENFFYTVKDPVAADSTIERSADIIAEKQKQIDLRTFNYFKNLRSLCTPDQLTKFDTLYHQVVRKMITAGKKPPPGKESNRKELRK